MNHTKTINFTDTVLSGRESILHIPEYSEVFQPTNPTHPFYQYHDKLYNPQRLLNGYMPILLGVHDFAPVFPVGMRILRTPIKVAGSHDVHIPDEVSFLTDFIKFCVMYELSFNSKNFVDLYAILTVHSKDVVVAERNTMRTPGFHTDGLQGSKFPIKNKLQHSYLWTNNNSTQFCPQPFFIDHLDDSKHMVFEEFDRQAKLCNIVTPVDKTVVLFDPYMVHRSPPISTDCTRMLMRISFMYEQLKDQRDTVNPNLPVDVPMRYDVRDHLTKYPGNVPFGVYGLKPPIISRL